MLYEAFPAETMLTAYRGASVDTYFYCFLISDIEAPAKLLFYFDLTKYELQSFTKQ